MFLKSLELEGFKSFVDPTHIDFTAGFTAIVGPNGCGKSNVSDAIRWVIGEQSSKSLRGNRITDLIFNGTTARKPVNRTEISLTLTRVPSGIRIANVANLSEEVKITRCYHRSGESEFYINQVPCRLKDITDFLLDIGISPKVLTVIEQGHIQDIITSKPENRRILVEEAAGILKFKHRKNEAIRKLDVSRQNLERITDIVQELGRQAESLKRQAAKAERYKRYQAEVKDLSLRLFSKKIRRYRQELEVVETDYTQQSQLKTERSARASSLDNQIENINLEIDEKNQVVNRMREQVHDLANRISKGEHTIELKQTAASQAAADIESALQEIGRMKEEIDSLTSDIEEQRRQLDEVSDQINQQETVLEEQGETQNQARTDLREGETRVQSTEKQVLELFQRISQKKNEITALETRRQALEHRNQKLLQEQGETAGEAEQVRQALDCIRREQEDKQGSLNDLLAQRHGLLENTSRDREELQARNNRLAETKEDYLNRASLLASLKELRHKFEGFGEGIKSLLGANTNGDRIPGLREVLVDVLKAPPEFELAIETVLGDKLQSIIVNTYPDSIEAINYLRDHHSGRGSFIPLRPKGTPSAPVYLNGNPLVLGRATDFIECRDEYRPIVEHLLGNVVLVDDLKTAMDLHQKPEFQGTIVTRHGEMIDSQGLVSGGVEGEASSNLLAQKREIEELSLKVGELQQEMESAQTAVTETEQQLSERDVKLQAMNQAVQQAEIGVAHGQKDLEQMRQELDRLEQKRETLNYEKNAGLQELEELNAQQTAQQQSLAAAEEERLREEESLNRFRHDLESRRARLEELSGEISKTQVSIASLKGRRENTLTEINRLELHQDNLRHRIQKHEQDNIHNRDKITQTEQAVAALEKEIVEFAREKDQLAQKIVQEEESLQAMTNSQREMEQETKDLARQVQELTEAISRIELKRSEIKIEIAHLEERAYNDFNVTLSEMMSSFSEEIDEEESETRIRELKEKVARMGEVNLAALSDFQQTNERFTFLKNQQEDLAQSIQMLHETIEKINRTTKQRFLDTFHQVNENFKGIFARLFQGGTAELTLLDPANPLESGIEITANPVGKKTQNISLLSGGEKAMTAIALIFSVFKVRPSPFCLLDEVDAPLDEANVIRFQEMLKEMSVDTQFILITHNQKTMSFADVLYGITMEERGVSKAVSVHLN